MNRATIACLLVLAGAAGCKKSELTEEDRAAKASAAAAAEAGTTAATTDAGAAVEAGATAGPAKSFAGKYTVTAGSKMLGEGELTLSVDASGRVSGGTEAGPLGASVVDGTSDGTTLTATVRRKDPTDEGLTGTLQAKVAGDTVEGTMNLAESNAAVVRFARFQAKKK